MENSGTIQPAASLLHALKADSQAAMRGAAEEAIWQVLGAQLVVDFSPPQAASASTSPPSSPSSSNGGWAKGDAMGGLADSGAAAGSGQSVGAAGGSQLHAPVTIRYLLHLTPTAANPLSALSSHAAATAAAEAAAAAAASAAALRGQADATGTVHGHSSGLVVQVFAYYGPCRATLSGPSHRLKGAK